MPNHAAGLADVDAARAEVLLAATNAFLRCEDLSALGAAITDALCRAVGASKAAVGLLGEDGRIRLAASRGYTESDLRVATEAIETSTPLIERASAGLETWSTDPDGGALLERVAAYGAASGFSVPIISTGRLIGTISVLFDRAETFPPAVRRLARSLAAQAALAWELIGAREDHRRAAIEADQRASELERQRARSGTLLELSTLLAAVHDAGEIARLTCDFVRRASRAEFAMLGRRDPSGDGFTIAATSGLSDDQVGLIAAALRRTDRPSLRQLLSGGITARSGESAVGEGMGIGEAMGAPIVADGRTIGFIAVGAPTAGSVSHEDWQDLLVAFAAVTATALGRAEAVGLLASQRDQLASQVEERTQSLRAALEELRLASDAKTQFLANVSHELRTPLTAILGFSEILQSGMDGRLSAEQARDVTTIQVSSRHLLELIDDLIDIASIESGRVQVLVGPVVAADVIRDAAATIQPLAGEKGIALEVAEGPVAAGGAPIRVVADLGRLREILLNLLSNAVKFTPSGGRVRVSMAIEEPAAGVRSEGATESTPMAAIAVCDTGRGIAADDIERIFEKFVRIAGPGTPGTGLGLPISRELARLHGGDLTVESTPGLGSTFTVRIPLASS